MLLIIVDMIFLCKTFLSKCQKICRFFSTLSIESISWKWYDNKNDYSKEGRVYIEAKVKVNNKELTIGTTHLSYTDRFKETESKDKEVNNLISCIKKDRYILAGDFNTHKTSKYIKWIEKILVNNDTSNTWTTKPFSYNGFEETELNWKLDYIFTSRDIKVKETKVIDTKYSDHLPILITLELQ